MPPGSRWGLTLSGLHKAFLFPIRRYLQRLAEADEAKMQAAWDEEQKRRRESLERE